MIILRIRELWVFSKYDREVVRVFQIHEHHAKIMKLGRYEPAKGQIICQRTDYLSFYRFTNLLKDRLKL